MKTLYLTRGGSNVLVDLENNTANRISTRRGAIDSIYLAEEPMHIVYGSGEYKKELDAEKNDIIVTFYHDTFKNQIIVIKNEDWFDNLVEYEKKQQEEKERWAASQALNNKSENDAIG